MRFVKLAEKLISFSYGKSEAEKTRGRKSGEKKAECL
jgi:hypothetical protein